MIHTRNLTKIHRNGGVEQTILQNVNIDIEAGEFVCLLGPSGSGKTTLMNIFGLIDTPTSGDFLMMGYDVTKLKERQRINLRRGSIGNIFRNFGLIDELNVYENIELPLQYLKYNKQHRFKKVNSILEELNITHLKSYYTNQLNGLQQQLVGIGRAMVIDPDIILADEPTGCLNSSSGSTIMNTLNLINEKGTTIVMASHSANDAEKSQRIIQVFDGHIITENIKNRL
ncbi:ABC transporter ATP-binding protein [Carboxylicivirga caseinilyticus]|uniref:ABC transporter ATP-binding protein n=1 Tax=Carboxylicivirga caseinilyticus TaxID=3417572 RepID=UPI003D341015|nr:ABC transporter ATP-binding protein [Marinilabiliaceae bacterium A049]